MANDKLDQAEDALSDADVQGHENPADGDDQDFVVTATGGTCNG